MEKQTLNEFIKTGWGKARATAGERDLELPRPFVPPSITSDGLFRTLFYWDTYFTNIGLIADGYVDWAKDNVDDLLYALRHFGCVPNYTRKDGADYCSQPPLLALMIRDIYAETKDEAWMAQAIAGLEKEYLFWMTKRITPIGLNQYGCNATTKELLLSYYDYISTRVTMPQDIPDEEKIRVAKNFLAEAESGEDYTPRYEKHNALDYVQIDLNSHLYGVEDILANYFKDRNAEKYAYYNAQKNARVERIEKYCFNPKTGTYCDYNFVADKKNEIVCAACFLPYYYGYARKDGNVLHVYNVLKTKGGVAACQETEAKGFQWGYPYIWAPYQYFAYKALKNYGANEQAAELRANYMRLLSTVYDETQFLWERYDENGRAAELEYPTQPMLGWTAGVYNYLYAEEKR